MKKRFTDEQIIGFLKQADGGVLVKELCGSMVLAMRRFTPGAQSLVE